MPPKGDKPATRSATQEQATASATSPGAEGPTATAPSAAEIRALLEKHAALMDSHHELLVKHDRLATKQQSDVQDLCNRLDSLQLRSGRTSPHRASPAATTTAAAPEPTKGEETAPTAAAPARGATTTVATATQPSAAATDRTEPSSTSPTTPQQGAAPAYKSSPWASWDPKIRNEVSFLLDRRGLSLTKLFDDEPASSSRDPTLSRENAAVINPRQLHCKHETLGLGLVRRRPKQA
ncbi:hypothetical protein OC842_007379 [Tilletia horrida]|uniref:Uncharacterized protein n=1 Tax=Tilletia horrida TaxID=155126 RepID=A0AAN6G4I0_9BASI|nr:hypothetical protein OC842_007379 [Tilletia horrida]